MPYFGKYCIWSQEHWARKTYDCDECQEVIGVCTPYSREVWKQGKGLRVIRRHTVCPDGPELEAIHGVKEIHKDCSTKNEPDTAQVA